MTWNARFFSYFLLIVFLGVAPVSILMADEETPITVTTKRWDKFGTYYIYEQPTYRARIADVIEVRVTSIAAVRSVSDPDDERLRVNLEISYIAGCSLNEYSSFPSNFFSEGFALSKDDLKFILYNAAGKKIYDCLSYIPSGLRTAPAGHEVYDLVMDFDIPEFFSKNLHGQYFEREPANIHGVTPIDGAPVLPTIVPADATLQVILDYDVEPNIVEAFNRVYELDGPDYKLKDCITDIDRALVCANFNPAIICADEIPFPPIFASADPSQGLSFDIVELGSNSLESSFHVTGVSLECENSTNTFLRPENLRFEYSGGTAQWPNIEFYWDVKNPDGSNASSTRLQQRGYQIQVATDPYFNDLHFDFGPLWFQESGSGTTQMNWSPFIEELPEDTFYWRVREVAFNCYGPWNKGAAHFCVDHCPDKLMEFRTDFIIDYPSPVSMAEIDPDNNNVWDAGVAGQTDKFRWAVRKDFFDSNMIDIDTIQWRLQYRVDDPNCDPTNYDEVAMDGVISIDPDFEISDAPLTPEELLADQLGTYTEDYATQSVCIMTHDLTTNELIKKTGTTPVVVSESIYGNGDYYIFEFPIPAGGIALDTFNDAESWQEGSFYWKVTPFVPAPTSAPSFELACYANTFVQTMVGCPSISTFDASNVTVTVADDYSDLTVNWTETAPSYNDGCRAGYAIQVGVCDSSGSIDTSKIYKIDETILNCDDPGITCSDTQLKVFNTMSLFNTIPPSGTFDPNEITYFHLVEPQSFLYPELDVEAMNLRIDDSDVPGIQALFNTYYTEVGENYELTTNTSDPAILDSLCSLGACTNNYAFVSVDQVFTLEGSYLTGADPLQDVDSCLCVQIAPLKMSQRGLLPGDSYVANWYSYDTVIDDNSGVETRIELQTITEPESDRIEEPCTGGVVPVDQLYSSIRYEYNIWDQNLTWQGSTPPDCLFCDDFEAGSWTISLGTYWNQVSVDGPDLADSYDVTINSSTTANVSFGQILSLAEGLMEGTNTWQIVAKKADCQDVISNGTIEIVSPCPGFESGNLNPILELGDTWETVYLYWDDINADSYEVTVNGVTTTGSYSDLNGAAYTGVDGTNTWGITAVKAGCTAVAYSENIILVPFTCSNFTVSNNVSAGTHHTIAVRDDGSLWGWGANEYGQVGFLNNHESVDTPQRLTGTFNWEKVSANRYQSYAIKTNGTLWAWGFNSGILGVGNNDATIDVPTQIGLSPLWDSVSAGSSHGLGIQENGTQRTLWAWGYNGRPFPNEGDGRIGNGDTADTIYQSPIQIGSDTDWKMVSAGDRHSMAIKTNGTLWAWGSNVNGILGDPSLPTRRNATPVQIGTDTNWAAVDASVDFTLAMKTDGTLWGWGDNDHGQLGMGHTTNVSVPTQIGTDSDWKTCVTSGNIPSDNDGFAHVVALKTDGTMWVWGENSYGELGLPVGQTTTMPVQIGQSRNWDMAATGNLHSHAVDENGKLFAWGNKTFGAVGTGDYFVNTARHIIKQVCIQDPETIIDHVSPLDNAPACKPELKWEPTGHDYAVEVSTDSDFTNPVRIGTIPNCTGSGGLPCSPPDVATQGIRLDYNLIYSNGTLPDLGELFWRVAAIELFPNNSFQIGTWSTPTSFNCTQVCLDFVDSPFSANLLGSPFAPGYEISINTEPIGVQSYEIYIIDPGTGSGTLLATYPSGTSNLSIPNQPDGEHMIRLEAIMSDCSRVSKDFIMEVELCPDYRVEVRNTPPSLDIHLDFYWEIGSEFMQVDRYELFLNGNTGTPDQTVTAGYVDGINPSTFSFSGSVGVNDWLVKAFPTHCTETIEVSGSITLDEPPAGTCLPSDFNILTTGPLIEPVISNATTGTSGSQSTIGCGPYVYLFGGRKDFPLGGREQSFSIQYSKMNNDGSLIPFTFTTASLPTSTDRLFISTTEKSGHIYLFIQEMFGSDTKVYRATPDHATGDITALVPQIENTSDPLVPFVFFHNGELYQIFGIKSGFSGAETEVFKATINATNGDITTWTSLGSIYSGLPATERGAIDTFYHTSSGDIINVQSNPISPVFRIIRGNLSSGIGFPGSSSAWTVIDGASSGIPNSNFQRWFVGARDKIVFYMDILYEGLFYANLDTLDGLNLISLGDFGTSRTQGILLPYSNYVYYMGGESSITGTKLDEVAYFEIPTCAE